MEESTGAFQPGRCNPQPFPVESSQTVSGQSSEMLAWKPTVMASAYSSTPEITCTLNSTAHPGKTGEPSETSSVNQIAVSLQQKKFPEDTQLKELNNTPKICHPHAQNKAVLEARESLYIEGHWMRTVNFDKTLGIQNTALNDSERIPFGNHHAAPSGSHADQNSNVDRSLDYFSEQSSFRYQQRDLVANNRFNADLMIPSNEYQAFYEPPVRDNHDHMKLYYQKSSFRGQNVYRGQDNLVCGEHFLSGYQLSGHRCDQNLMVSHWVTNPIGGQTFYGFQMPNTSFGPNFHGSKRATSNAEENMTWHPQNYPSSKVSCYLHQMRSSDPNVYPCLNGTPNVEKRLDPQVNSFCNQDHIAWDPETSPSSKELYSLDQMKTSVNPNIHPSLNGKPNVEKSIDPQVTSLSKEDHLACHPETSPSPEETFSLDEIIAFPDSNASLNLNGATSIEESQNAQVTSLSNPEKQACHPETSPSSEESFFLDEIIAFPDSDASSSLNGSPNVEENLVPQVTSLSNPANLDCHPEASPSSEESFFLDDIIAFLDSDAFQSLHGTPKVEGSLDPQVTSLSNQVNLAWHPETSPLSEESFFLDDIMAFLDSDASPSVNGTPDVEEKLDPQVTSCPIQEHLAWHPERIPSSEESFSLDHLRTSLEPNVYPSSNGTPNVVQSLDHHVTLLSNQAPYVGESSNPSSYPSVQRQPQASSSASDLVQGKGPELNADLQTLSPVSPINPQPLKRYSCSYPDCGKSYTKAHHLKDHMKKHTGKRSYECNVPGCKWTFYRSTDLKRHIKKHSGERPHACPLCNKSYSRTCYLKQHLKSHSQASFTSTN